MSRLRRQERRARGEGEIRQLSDGTFVARISLGSDTEGNRVRKRITAETENQLRLKIAREQQRFSQQPRYFIDAQRISLGAFLEEWLEDEVRPNTRLATYQLRERTCRNHIIPYLGQVRLADLEPAHVRGLLKNLRSQNIGGRTMQVVHATLSCALGIAVRDELLERNVAAIVERPKAVKRQKHILDEEQAKQLLELVKGDEYEALYVLALTTGLRQGELFALHWADVDLQRAAIRVRATLTEDEDGKLVRTDPKTESSRRIVDLPQIAVDALRDHRVRTEGFDGYVFRDSAGGPMRKSNFLRRHFHPTLERPRVCEVCKTSWMRDPLERCPTCGSDRSERGIPHITFHSLRHVANSILLAHGANVRLLADRLGHSTTRTTIEHYSHVLTGAQREAARTLDGIFGT